jgi:hypothetical protein
MKNRKSEERDEKLYLNEKDKIINIERYIENILNKLYE